MPALQPVLRPVFIPLVILALLAGWPGRGQAQTFMEGGARAAALGGAATALAQELSGYANPATWATVTGRGVAFFASQAFGLPALRLGAVAYVEPTRLGAFAAGARTFGFEAYRETHLHVGSARGFRLGTTRRFHLGVGVQYRHLAIPAYGQEGTFTANLGGLVAVHPGLLVGFHAANVLGGGEDRVRSLALGLAYTPADPVLVVVDVYKDVRFPLSVRAGIEAHPVSALFLRAGATTAPARLTTGIGLRLGHLTADVAGERHEALGWSPAVSLGIRW